MQQTVPQTALTLATAWGLPGLVAKASPRAPKLGGRTTQDQRGALPSVRHRPEAPVGTFTLFSTAEP